MDRRTSRREFLATAAGAALLSAARPAAGAAPAPTATALPRATEEAIRKVVGAAPITPGRVTLELPPLVENGNTVPLAVSVESPMTAVDHVRAIHVFTEKNPQPDVASFRFGPRAGRARVATRIRLADTQTVIAVAELSDGSFWSARVAVVVTLAACLEEA
jgi:sulfur-oxidizing protein SoxY